jgi:hypothetical protein
MLLAFVPLSTLASERSRKAIGRGAALLVLAFCTVIISIVLFGAAARIPTGASEFVVIPLLLAAHLVTVYCGFRLVKRLPFLAALAIVGAGVAMLWIVPLMLQLVWSIATGPAENASMGFFGSLSPLGLLISTVSPELRFTPVPGLILQWLFAGILVAIVMSTMRSKQTPVPVTAAPPAATSS